MIERTNLPIDALALDPMQSRERAWSGDDPDQKLAASIASAGLYQDIIVRPLDNVELGVTHTNTDNAVEQDAETNIGAKPEAEYTIVAGSRRYHAAMEAGYESVPCKIVSSSDLQAAWTSLSENTDRRDLSEQEVAQQLSLIYELVRPKKEPTACPGCGVSVSGESGLLNHCRQGSCELPDPTTESDENKFNGTVGSEENRFSTEKQALEYLAKQFLGRDDAGAIGIVRGHLQTATLPPILQSLFKTPSDRTAQERMVLDNYGIDALSRLGSGEGKSGTSAEVVKLHETIEAEIDADEVDPTDAVLEAVGSLRYDEMSEQELRRTLREFRHTLRGELGGASPADHEKVFGETLQRQAADLKTSYETIEPTRPFKKVDVLGPDTQRHSRWHALVMNRRDVRGHGELVRELYQERLESLAEEEGWE